MQDVGERRARLAAAVASVVVPALLVAGLLRLPLPGLDVRMRQPGSAAIDVVFLRRTAAPAMRRPPPRSAPRRHEDGSTKYAASAPGEPQGRDARGIDAGSSGLSPDHAPIADRDSALNLTVRDPASSRVTARDARDWLERERVLDPRTTRFEKAWVPAGNAVEQARFRSPAVNAALGLFGGAPRRCSETERRLRLPDCLSLDADAGELEALRRAID